MAAIALHSCLRLVFDHSPARMKSPGQACVRLETSTGPAIAGPVSLDPPFGSAASHRHLRHLRVAELVGIARLAPDPDAELVGHDARSGFEPVGELPVAVPGDTRRRE